MQEQNEFQPSFADPTQPMEAEERTFYRNSTRDLVSRVAYLIGVPKRMFENEHEPPQLDIYDRLDKEKNARIIRNLCLIRTAIQRNFKYINEGMRFEHRSILTMPEYVPVESINQLELDGVRFIKSPASSSTSTSSRSTGSSPTGSTTASPSSPCGSTGSISGTSSSCPTA